MQNQQNQQHDPKRTVELVGVMIHVAGREPMFGVHEKGLNPDFAAIMRLPVPAQMMQLPTVMFQRGLAPDLVAVWNLTKKGDVVLWN